MCGIAGFAADHGSTRERAEALLGCLRARGPDASWTVERMGLALVQTRLSVIDLSERVVYPMPNEAGDVWLLFNGEIYDFKGICEQLGDRGHTFRTECDAEVVLHAYEEWGVSGFARLNGMFAAAIVDEREGKLVLTRDRFGIKPLVRTIGEPFAFASDAMALVAAGLSPGEVDETALAEFAAFHYVPPPRTGIAGIEQVEPGTAVVRSRDGGEQVTRWAPDLFERETEGAPRMALAEVDEALREAVRRQLVADVDVGIFLSGGIDSSLLLLYAAELGARPRCFTIGFPGHGDYDEQPHAHQLTAHLGVTQESESFSLSFPDAVRGVAEAFDQPFADSSAVPTLMLARLARGAVTVALSGTGGDDLFAGYYRHRAHRLRGPLNRLPTSLTDRVAGLADRRGGERAKAMQLARSYAVRLARTANSDPAEQYLELVASSTSPRAISVFRSEIDPAGAAIGVAERHGLLEGGRPDTLRRLQSFELATYLPGDLLAKEDRATMAVGLEGRVPLLDEQVAKVAAALPDSQKISLMRGKRPLVDIAKSRLADMHVPTRKRGFAVPLGDLFEGPWAADAAEWFSDSPSELIDGRQVAVMARGKAISPSDVWALATLAAWEARLTATRKASPARVAAVPER